MLRPKAMARHPHIYVRLQVSSSSHESIEVKSKSGTSFAMCSGRFSITFRSLHR